MTDKEIATVDSLRKEGISSLKDSHGNPRFVEGDITMETIEGITQTYGKWSLSGTHLMIAITFKANSNTVLGNVTFAEINLPSYIFNKISALYLDIIETKNFNGWSNNFDVQTITMHLRKDTTAIDIRKGGQTITLNDDRNFRIQYDLIIDTD